MGLGLSQMVCAAELVSEGVAMQGTDMPKLCLLTPDPSYEENWQPMADQFRVLLGDGLTLRSWTNPGSLSGFDAVLPLLAWGYQRAPARWYDALDLWEAQGIAFANTIPLLRWNTDKTYLFGLAAQGVTIVPSLSTPALCAEDLDTARRHFATDSIVIKPLISGGADGTVMIGPTDSLPIEALGHQRLLQPMMPAIIDEGEYSLFYFGGVLSHAILKKPAAGDFRVQEQFGGRETAIEAPPQAQKLAEMTLAAAPAAPLYARVDMVREPGGRFCLMELEVIEPALFLSFAPDKGQSFAKAVLRALTA